METQTISTPSDESYDNTLTCSACGCIFPDDEVLFFGDRDLCQSCADELTSICYRCGERIWNDANEGNDDLCLCSNCYDSYYSTCECCGAIITQDDTYNADDCSYCYNCYNSNNKNRIIHSYSYKPEPIFYPFYIENEPYFGVELEIDNGGEDSVNAKELLAIGNRSKEHIYIKHDGSLDDGFEIVSHPATMDYHLHNIPWERILEQAVYLGYTSHKADTCGLHVHVSRECFGNDYRQQETAIARVLFFIESHFNEMLKFSRRTMSQMNRWAARYGYKEHPRDILDHAKSSNQGRYSAINLQNSYTIEFRMFRGTLKYNTFIAVLQMVSHICKAAISMSDDDFKAMSWQDFVLRYLLRAVLS
ncbi:MAG: amidoligase family protein [Eubacteriales bacterium]